MAFPISCRGCDAQFDLQVFHEVTEGDCPECGGRLKVPVALRAHVARIMNNRRRAEDEEYAQLMRSPTYQVEIVHKNQTFRVDVKAWFSIDVVKAKIRDIHGLDPCSFNLFSRNHGRTLQGSEELDDLAILSAHQLHLVEIKTRFNIKVQSVFLNITLDVEACDTILNVKAKIQDKEGIPISEQKLSLSPFGGDVALEDDHTLSDYKVSDGDTMFLSSYSSSSGAA